MFLALAFIAILSFTLIPAFAWHHPGPDGGTDDLYSEAFGPRPAEIDITVYGTQELEYIAFKAKEIDMTDWQLLPSQKDELDLEDPNQEVYARAFWKQFGMMEIDLHNLAGPCTDVEFRQALSRCIDKDYFIATELAGLGAKMDSPLASHGDPFYNHYCDDLYPYSLADAAAQLDAAGYKDYDGDGWRDYPDGTAILLLFWVRSDDPQRTALGVYFTEQLEVELAKEGPEYAGLNVDLHIAPKSTCFEEVMDKYNYDMYTGGWSFGRDPDTLYFLYHSAFAWEPDGIGKSPNYPGYMSAEFDVAIEDCVFAANIADSIAAAHVAQKIMMDDACIIPVWTGAGETPYLSTWEGVVNMVGDGPYGWWTFMNVHLADGTGSDDTFRWGFMNDIEALSIVHSEWVWDWQILDKIYDTLINYNGYDVTEDWPWIAECWDLGTYEHDVFGNCTKVTFYLRDDVYWQDLPYKADRVMPDGTPLPGPVTDQLVTAYDVNFTMIYIRDVDGETAWNQGAAADVVECEVIDDFTIAIYFDVYMPLWAVHWVGGLPIMPQYIWEHVPEAIGYDPIVERTLVGCGPYEFDYDRMVPHEYYYLTRYDRYFNSYANAQMPNSLVGLRASAVCEHKNIRIKNSVNVPKAVNVRIGYHDKYSSYKIITKYCVCVPPNGETYISPQLPGVDACHCLSVNLYSLGCPIDTNATYLGDITNSTTYPPGPAEGKVDYKDLFWLLKNYGAIAGDPRWIANYGWNTDIASGTTDPPPGPEGKVDYKDLFWLLRNYGEPK